MEISTSNFLANFAKQFENTDKSLIMLNTNFKDLAEWDSLIALSVIAMADEDFGVTLTGDDIRKSSTIEELFQIIKSKA